MTEPSAPFRVVDPDDPLWARVYDGLPDAARDVFHCPGFARLCQRTLYRDWQVLAAVLRTPRSTTLYPFVLRDIGSLLEDRDVADGLKDVTALYGRGGPVCDRRVPEDVAAFHAAFGSWCRCRGVVCGFDRFHPVMGNEALAAPETRLFDVGGFVVVDLRHSSDRVETGFKYSMRKALKKGERAGVEVFCEENLDHIDAFFDIYHSTLRRRNARPFYFFSRSFYEKLPRELAGRFVFFYGNVGGRTVTCELALSDGIYCHSFLGGTHAEALAKSPNQVLKRDMIRHFKRRGCHHFLLGGGQERDDGVFHYKRAFAPEGVVPSVVGGTIHHAEAYGALRERMIYAGMDVKANRFQFYDPS